MRPDSRGGTGRPRCAPPQRAGGGPAPSTRRRSTRSASAFPDPCIRPSLVWRALTAGMVTAVILCTFGAFWIAVRAEKGRAPALAAPVRRSLPGRDRADGGAPRSRAARGGRGDVVLGCGLPPRRNRPLPGREHEASTGRRPRRDARGGHPRMGRQRLAMGKLALRRSLGRLAVRLPRTPAARARALLRWAAWRWPVWPPGALTAPRGRRPIGERRRWSSWPASSPPMPPSTSTRSRRISWKIFGRSTWAPSASSPRLFVLSAVGTALVPLVILTWGIGSRRTFLIDTGIVLLGLSLVTLRYYVHIAPLWVVLTGAGARTRRPRPRRRAGAPARAGRRYCRFHRRSAVLGRAAPAGAPDRPRGRHPHPTGAERTSRGQGLRRRRRTLRGRRGRGEVLS